MIRPIGQDAAAVAEPSHGKIWGVAVLAGIVLTWLAGVALGFVYGMLPYDLLELIAANDLAFRVVLLALFTVAVALVLYKLGVFRSAAPPAQRFTAGLGAATAGATAGGAVLAYGGGAAAATSTTDGELGAPTLAVLIQSKRHCTGDLYMPAGQLVFICHKDQSIAAANAGKAVAQQFGLIGALIGALVASAGAKKREAELEEARAAAAAVAMPERLQLSEYSFALPAGEITRIKNSFWSGTFIEAGGRKLAFQGIDKPTKAALAAWCQKQNVAQEGLV